MTCRVAVRKVIGEPLRECHTLRGVLSPCLYLSLAARCVDTFRGLDHRHRIAGRIRRGDYSRSPQRR